MRSSVAISAANRHLRCWGLARKLREIYLLHDTPALKQFPRQRYQHSTRRFLGGARFRLIQFFDREVLLDCLFVQQTQWYRRAYQRISATSSKTFRTRKMPNLSPFQNSQQDQRKGTLRVECEIAGFIHASRGMGPFCAKKSRIFDERIFGFLVVVEVPFGQNRPFN